MRKYHASGVVPAGGGILLVLLAVVSGLIVGGILWAIDNFIHFYLVLAFPLFAGAIAGAVLALVVASAVIAALVMYGTYHFAGYYVSFRGEIRNLLVERGAKSATEADVDAFADQILQSEVGDTGLLGYLKLNAREGITITRATAVTSETGMTLQGTGVWIYWGVEILLAALMAAIAAGRAAGQQRWRSRRANRARTCSTRSGTATSTEPAAC